MNPSPRRKNHHYRREKVGQSSNAAFNCDNNSYNGGNNGCDVGNGNDGVNTSNNSNASSTTHKGQARNGAATSSFLASLPSRHRKKRRQSTMFRSQKKVKSTNSTNTSTTSITSASVVSSGSTNSHSTSTSSVANKDSSTRSANPTSRSAKQTDRNVNMPLHTTVAKVDTAVESNNDSRFSASKTKIPMKNSKESIRKAKEHDLLVANVCSSLNSLSQSQLKIENNHNNDFSLVFSSSESESQIQQFLQQQQNHQSESDADEAHMNNLELPQSDEVETANTTKSPTSKNTNCNNNRRNSNGNDYSDRHTEINTMNLTTQLQQLISSHIAPQMQSLQTQLQEYKDENKTLKQQQEKQKEGQVKSIKALTQSYERRIKNQENECRSLQRQVHNLQNIVNQKDQEIENMTEKVRIYSTNLKEYKDQITCWLEKAGFQLHTTGENSNRTFVISRVVKWEVMPPPSLLNISPLDETYRETNTATIASSSSYIGTPLRKNQRENEPESYSRENLKPARKDNDVADAYDQNIGQEVVSFENEKKYSSISRRTAKLTDTVKKSPTNRKSENDQQNSSVEKFDAKSPLNSSSSSKAFSIKKVNNEKTKNDRPSLSKLKYNGGDQQQQHQQKQQHNIKFEVRINDDDSVSSDEDEETQKEISDTQQDETNVSEIFDFSPAICSKKTPLPPKKDSMPRFVTPATTRSNKNSEASLKRVRLKKNCDVKDTDEVIVKKEETSDELPRSIFSDHNTTELRKNKSSGIKQKFEANLRNQKFCAPAKEVSYESKQIGVPNDPMLNTPLDRTVRKVKEKGNNEQKNKFKYQEVVRGKKARQALRGHSCEECDKFIKAIYDHPGGEVFSEHMFTRCSRHRSEHTPPKTPLDFWDLDFIDERKPVEKSDSQSQKFDEV